MKNTKLYVDDVRPRPDETWDLAPNFHVAILNLEIFDYEEVSLDHDLASFYGHREMTGRDILNWLIARRLEGKHTPHRVKVHSANSAAWPGMQEDIDRYFPGDPTVEDLVSAKQDSIHIQKGILRRSTPIRKR